MDNSAWKSSYLTKEINSILLAKTVKEKGEGPLLSTFLQKLLSENHLSVVGGRGRFFHHGASILVGVSICRRRRSIAREDIAGRSAGPGLLELGLRGQMSLNTLPTNPRGAEQNSFLRFLNSSGGSRRLSLSGRVGSEFNGNRGDEIMVIEGTGVIETGRMELLSGGEANLRSRGRRASASATTTTSSGSSSPTSLRIRRI